jgi:sugar lactone lactonase YvrE
MSHQLKLFTAAAVCCLCATTFTVQTEAQGQIVDFEADRWVLQDAEIVEHLGRTALMGTAYLKDVEFENGVVEVDIAVERERTYPGIVFRRQSDTDYEDFYIRPHRMKFYSDALQYTPVINGISCWQLCNGAGYTAGGQIPINEWVHLKLEISGKQARVFLGEAESPALVITDLKHGISKGTIGVKGRRDRAAFFSNFSYRIDDGLEFDPPAIIDTPPGIVGDWRISQTFKLSQIDMERHPGEQELPDVVWQQATAEPPGIVNVARYHKRSGNEPDCIIAKTVLNSDAGEVRNFQFGYSDAVSIFLNGEIVFLGSSAYQQRDPSFLGIMGLFDTVYLPLKKGENELLLWVAESFGGWGFVFQDAGAVFQHEDVSTLWETEKEFLIPETVVYDPAGEMLYVTNFDAYNKSPAGEGQCISKVSLNGEIQELKWATGLAKPTGMAVVEDKLLVVERGGLAEIDLESGEVTNRYPVSGQRFLNDMAVDASGDVYISDSGRNTIFKFSGGEFEVWLEGGAIVQPNGLHVHGEKLILGNNGDNSVKAIDLTTKEISVIQRLGEGIIDGIETDSAGNYIVSHWEGRVYRISPSGETTKILDTTNPGYQAANFACVPGKDLLLIPTFLDGRVMAYELAR